MLVGMSDAPSNETGETPDGDGSHAVSAGLGPLPREAALCVADAIARAVPQHTHWGTLIIARAELLTLALRYTRMAGGQP